MKATAMLPANPTLLRASESQTAAPQQDPDDHDDDVDQACWVFTRTKWGDNTRDLRRRYTTGSAHVEVRTGRSREDHASRRGFRRSGPLGSSKPSTLPRDAAWHPAY
jgi:hypothetical protein